MDWRKVTSEIESLDELDASARRDRLSELADDAAGRFVTGYFERRRRAESFMLTVDDRPHGLLAEPLADGTRVGNWRIEQFLAAGGMGEVYEAVRDDGLYEQRVALKVLANPSERWRERFTAERQRLAALDHPGICRIVDGGESDDQRPFMAMELINGTPIDEHAEHNNLDRRARVILMLELCDALAHAHARLILHRDIKPSNVLVDQGGHIRLIDFGIASLIAEDDLQAIGPLTIAYAAPEQLDAQPPSIAADIFTCGLLLHQLTTGHLPVRERDGGVIIDVNHFDDVDLAAIVRKATATNPMDRYAAVGPLADDLRALLDRRPVTARDGGRWYRIRKAMQRSPVALSLGAALLVALGGGLAMTYAQSQSTIEQRDRAEFFLAEARSNSGLQATYRDILDRVFTTEQDSARIREVMLARATQALDNQTEDPNGAARICLVVGTHFLNAYDYETARSVLEPWVQAGFGDDSTLRLGKMRLADIYNAVGESQLGLALLREIAPSFDNPNRFLSNEHLAFAFELAYSTDDPVDEAYARDLMEQAIANDSGNEPDRLLSALHYLQYLQKDAGQFELAHETMKRAAALYETTALSDHSSWGITQIYLATYEYYVQRNPALAEQMTDALIRWSDENGSPDDQAYRLKAELLADRGDFEVAAKMIERAYEVEMQYFGTAEFSEFGRIEISAQSGDLERANQLLDAFVANAESQTSAPIYHTRFALAAAYVALLESGPSAAETALGRFGFRRENATSDPARMYRVERLEMAGVRTPATSTQQKSAE